MWEESRVLGTVGGGQFWAISIRLGRFPALPRRHDLATARAGPGPALFPPLRRPARTSSATSPIPFRLGPTCLGVFRHPVSVWGVLGIPSGILVPALYS